MSKNDALTMVRATRAISDDEMLSDEMLSSGRQIPKMLEEAHINFISRVRKTRTEPRKAKRKSKKALGVAGCQIIFGIGTMIANAFMEPGYVQGASAGIGGGAFVNGLQDLAGRV